MGACSKASSVGQLPRSDLGLMQTCYIKWFKTGGGIVEGNIPYNQHRICVMEVLDNKIGIKHGEG